ncbi:MAG: hypothetical protein IPK82_20805 [Polyangiaceae bacterium]|nr:hypothetical protein [Polyangiaceae bacterium]
MTIETLAHDVGWDASGHLSDVALTVVADGEEALLDGAMSQHLNTCSACSARLGEVAMRSADVAAVFGQLSAENVANLRAENVVQAAPVVQVERDVIALPAEVVSPAASSSRNKRKVPVRVIAIAFVVASLGALPSIVSIPERASQLWTVVRKVLPSLIRMSPGLIERAWHPSSGRATLLVYTLAFALCAAGFLIATKASKRAAFNGGRQ